MEMEHAPYDLITEITLFQPEDGGLRYGGFETGFRSAHFALPDDPIEWMVHFDPIDGVLLNGETGTVYISFIMGVAHLIGRVAVGTPFFVQVRASNRYGTGVVTAVLDLEGHAERDRRFEAEWAKRAPLVDQEPRPQYRRKKQRKT